MFFSFFFLQDHQAALSTVNSLCRPWLQISRLILFTQHTGIYRNRSKLKTLDFKQGVRHKSKLPGLGSLKGAAGLHEPAVSMLLVWLKQEDVDLALSGTRKDERNPPIWYFQWLKPCTQRGRAQFGRGNFPHLWSHFAALEPHVVIDSEYFGWAVGNIVWVVFHH